MQHLNPPLSALPGRLLAVVIVALSSLAACGGDINLSPVVDAGAEDRSVMPPERRTPCDPAAPACEAGNVCVPLSLTPNEGSCAPSCAVAGCPSGQQCNATTGLCECGSDAWCTTELRANTRCVDGRCALACDGDADCWCGSHCAAGRCVAGCDSDGDCCGGACVDGRCSPGGGLRGTRCSRQDQCSSGLTCDQGQCLPRATSQLCAAGTCPTGTICRAVAQSDGSWRSYCPEACSPGATPSGCASGMACRPRPEAPGTGYCVRACEGDGDCSSGFVCDPTLHVCHCGADRDCVSGGYGSQGRCDATQRFCACTPNCAGRACGGDGCGGMCGSCGAGQICSAGGQCGPPACVAENFTVSCGNGSACPTNGRCTGMDGCECTTGFVATGCSGAPCDGSNPECRNSRWWCAPRAQCTPNCAGRSCGPDGCGGVCGTCSGGQTCSDGVCRSTTCTPSCSGCGGPNGCGGICGCAGGQTCSGGRCVTSCTPNCSGLVCGSNGCGGTCGTCPSGQACSGGRCVTSCTPNCSGRTCGSNGCGGTCGTCASGQTCSTSGTCTGGSTGVYHSAGLFDGCVRSFYNAASYNWFAFENRCSEAVRITWACARPGCNGAASVAPGRVSTTGYSQSEINGYGGIQVVICRDGYIPVDGSDRYWTYGSSYRCKRQ